MLAKSIQMYFQLNQLIWNKNELNLLLYCQVIYLTCVTYDKWLTYRNLFSVGIIKQSFDKAAR